jgi:DNA-binding CsgD family transcriptional regulator
MRPEPYTIRLLTYLTLVHLLQGELASAKNTVATFAAYAGQAGLLLSQSWAHCFVGIIAYHQNRIEAAVTAHKQVLAMRFTANFIALFISLYDLILSAEAEEDWRWLQQQVANIQTDAHRDGNTAVAPVLEGMQALLLLRQGDVVGAQRWAVATSYRAGPQDSHILWLIWVRCMLAGGTPATLVQAKVAVDQLVESTRCHHINFYLYQALVLQALVNEQLGATLDAEAALSEALVGALPRGFRRIFLEHGTALAAPLQRLANRPETAAAVGELSALVIAPVSRTTWLNLTAAPPNATPSPPQQPHQTKKFAQEFSRREIEILELLARDFLNKEIAHELGISAHTVRNHLARIFSKLGVGTRRDAVRRARNIHEPN